MVGSHFSPGGGGLNTVKIVSILSCLFSAHCYLLKKKKAKLLVIVTRRGTYATTFVWRAKAIFVESVLSLHFYIWI